MHFYVTHNQQQLLFPNSSNWLAFLMEIIVYCELGTELLNIIHISSAQILP